MILQTKSTVFGQPENAFLPINMKHDAIPT